MLSIARLKVLDKKLNFKCQKDQKGSPYLHPPQDSLLVCHRWTGLIFIWYLYRSTMNLQEGLLTGGPHVTTLLDPPHPDPDMFKLVQLNCTKKPPPPTKDPADPVGKRVVGVRLNCLLVFCNYSDWVVKSIPIFQKTVNPSKLKPFVYLQI